MSNPNKIKLTVYWISFFVMVITSLCSYAGCLDNTHWWIFSLSYILWGISAVLAIALGMEVRFGVRSIHPLSRRTVFLSIILWVLSLIVIIFTSVSDISETFSIWIKLLIGLGVILANGLFIYCLMQPIKIPKKIK